MEKTDLNETYKYYSNMMKQDFLMEDIGIDINTMSLFNSYSTNPSDIEPIQLNNERDVDNGIKKNKKSRINIQNATIRRHSHIRPRRSKYANGYKSDNSDDPN